MKTPVSVVLVGCLVFVGCNSDAKSATDAGGRGDSGPGSHLHHDSGVAPEHDASVVLDAGTTVTFKVPHAGGKVTVAGADGKVEFDFPKSAGGMEITLTPASAASIGWPAGRLTQVIRMEPDGTKFADPVTVRPSSGDVLVLDFPSAKKKSAPQPLPLNAAGDGVLLSHFSTLAVVPAAFSCGGGSGFSVQTGAAAQSYCGGVAGFPTFITFRCDASPYCFTFDLQCCAKSGATSCQLGDAKLALAFSPAGTSGGMYPYCAPLVQGDAGMVIAVDAGTDSAVIDVDAATDAGTDASTGSAGTGAAGTGSAGTGTAGTGSAGTGSAGTGSAGTGSAGTGSAGTGSAGMGAAGTGSAGTGTAGTGVSNCKGSMVDCGTGCTDLTTDKLNCGSCNHPCSIGCIEGGCSQGVISTTCPQQAGAPWKSVKTSGVVPASMALADFNGDNKVDLAGGSIYETDLFLGAGDGTFAAASLPYNEDATALMVGDFDGDSHPDMASYELSVQWGSAPPLTAFTQQQFSGTLSFPGTDRYPTPPSASGDFDANNRSDLLIYTSGNTGVTQVFFDAARTISSIATVPMASAVTALAVGDITGDTVADAAALSNGQLWIFPSPLSSATAYHFAAANAGASLAAGKLDADGKADLVFTLGNTYSTSIGVYLSSLDQGVASSPITLLSMPIGVAVVVVGDFTHDNKNDIAAIGRTSIVLLPGNGDGTFGTLRGPYAITDSFGANGVGVSGDVTGDGARDIVRSLYSETETLVTCP